METFADVLHALIDTVFTGSTAEKAHAIITQASGPRTVTEEEPTSEEPPVEPSDEAVSGSEAAPPPAPPL